MSIKLLNKKFGRININNQANGKEVNPHRNVIMIPTKDIENKPIKIFNGNITLFNLINCQITAKNLIQEIKPIIKYSAMYKRIILKISQSSKKTPNTGMMLVKSKNHTE